ncbi:MAG: zonular occludens toxin domain-containing protein [Firmicutes bacterium]|nr:zonular occludens toxin domain-containing protein [Bacillota bacterium]
MKKPKLTQRVDVWQNFSAVYFILQYLVVHILFFGFDFKIDSVVVKAVTSFNYAEIANAIYNFRMVFIAGFTFQSVLVFIIVAIPYTLILVWALRYVIIYLFVVYQLLQYIRIKISQIKHERNINLDNVVVVKIGSPGCGKSSSGLYEAVVMARKMWSDLRWRYFKFVKKKDKPLDWNEIEFSYNFFKNSNAVPCLLSNIPIMVDGKYTTFVSKEHCEQRARLPAHCVLFLDEVGAMLSVDTAKQRMGDENEDMQNAVNVSDFFRLCRHFGNWRIICTEQDSENIYIDVRRVVSKNEYMIQQKWVLKPYAFLALLLPLKALAVRFVHWGNDSTRKGRIFGKLQKVLTPSLIFLEKICKAIGFRKYLYLTENNTERASGMETGKRTFYLPSLLNFKYDERTFRNFYKCKDETITPYVFDNLILEDTDTFKQMFLRSAKKRKK